MLIDNDKHDYFKNNNKISLCLKIELMNDIINLNGAVDDNRNSIRTFQKQNTINLFFQPIKSILAKNQVYSTAHHQPS